jgi:hypothetical protein
MERCSASTPELARFDQVVTMQAPGPSVPRPAGGHMTTGLQGIGSGLQIAGITLGLVVLVVILAYAGWVFVIIGGQALSALGG